MHKGDPFLLIYELVYEKKEKQRKEHTPLSHPCSHLKNVFLLNNAEIKSFIEQLYE